MKPISRRDLLQWSMIAAAGIPLHGSAVGATVLAAELPTTSGVDGPKIKDTTFQFIEKCARKGGGYSPSPDPQYQGSSDTAESDLAAVTYAATLAKPEGRTLAHAKKSADFIQHHQQPWDFLSIFADIENRLGWNRWNVSAQWSLEHDHQDRRAPSICVFNRPTG